MRRAGIFDRFLRCLNFLKNSVPKFLEAVQRMNDSPSGTTRPTSLKRKKLEALLEAAIWAPSGSNSQSGLFTAVQNQEV